MTGQALRFKDLTGVKFTPIGDRDNTTALISKTVCTVLVACVCFSFVCPLAYLLHLLDIEVT